MVTHVVAGDRQEHGALTQAGSDGNSRPGVELTKTGGVAGPIVSFVKLVKNPQTEGEPLES